MKYSGNEIFAGMYVIPYTMEVDARLKYCRYGQCGVRAKGTRIQLFSYTSLVLELDVDRCEVIFGDVNPDYSRTTIKHVGCFLKEYAPYLTYQDVKNNYYKVSKLSFSTKPYINKAIANI